MPYTQQPFDLASMILAVQKIKANEQQARVAEMQKLAMDRKLMEQAEQREVQQDIVSNPQLLAEAQQAAQQGRPEMLMQLQQQAPGQVQAAQELQKQLADKERAKRQFQLRALAASGRTAPSESRLFAPGSQELMTAQQAREELARIAPDDPWLKRQQELAKQQSSDFYKGMSKDYIEAANMFFGGPVSPDQLVNLTGEQKSALNRYVIEGQISKAPKTDIRIGSDDVMSQKLTGGQQAQQQGKVIDARRRLGQLGAIEASIKDMGGYRELSSIANTLEAKGLSLADRTELLGGFITDKTRGTLGKRATAVANLGAFRDEIIREISGAAVSSHEMARLVQSIPRPNDAPSEMEAKINTWKRNLRFIEKFGVEALFEGIRNEQMRLVESPSASETDSNKPQADISNMSVEELEKIAAGSK